jgi:hypothetical protein
MDRVLQPLQQRFKLVDSLLKGFDTPLVSRRGLGSRIRGPPAATQLNHTAENRHATHRPPTWIAGTRHGRNLPLPLFSEAARGEEEARPNERYGPHRPCQQDYSAAPPARGSMWRKRAPGQLDSLAVSLGGNRGGFGFFVGTRLIRGRRVHGLDGRRSVAPGPDVR